MISVDTLLKRRSDIVEASVDGSFVVRDHGRLDFGDHPFDVVGDPLSLFLRLLVELPVEDTAESGYRQQRQRSHRKR